MSVDLPFSVTASNYARSYSAFAEAARPWTGDFSWTEDLREQRRAAGGPTISALVHTLNEELNVADALRSLAWCDEIVVVDMHSDDRTVDIAREHGARVELFERCGYVEPARNHGIATSRGDWVLILDADERVPAPLAAALSQLAAAGDVDVVQVPHRNWLCGRWLLETGWGDEYHPRFFRRGSVRWGDRIHSLPEMHGRVAFLPRSEGHELLHFNYASLEQFVSKTNAYTSREAPGTVDWQQAAADARDEVLRRWSPSVDGTQSAALSVTMFFYRFLAAAKDWERRGWPDVGAPATAVEALRDLTSGSRELHARAVEQFGQGNVAEATDLARRAIGESLDVELLNDFAVILHAQGDTVTARSLLETCLTLEPGHQGAIENLAAIGEESSTADAPAAPVSPPPVIADGGPHLAARLAAICGSTAEEVEAALFFPGEPVAVSVDLLDGAPLQVRPGTSDVRVLEDTFGHLYHLPPAELDDPRLIVDLGSNIGSTIAHFAHLYPRADIVGIELDSETARVCRANIAHWGERCTLVEAALAAEDGTVCYAKAGSGNEWGYAIGSGNGATAAAVSLDTLLKRTEPGRPIDYLKVDIEGAEREVFARGGDWVERVRLLRVEVHPPYVVEEAVRDLEALGFRCRVDDHHFSCVIAERDAGAPADSAAAETA